MARVLERGRTYPKELYGSPTHVSWNSMVTRCTSKSNKKFIKNYQERGITFDPSWKYFSNFLKDMGIRPEGTTLDRIDNSKGYYKSNCRWATLSTQNSNRRTSSNTGLKHISLFKGVYLIHVKPFRIKRSVNLTEAKEIKDYLLKLRKENIKFKEGTMLVDQITYTKRFNDGNYNHSEITITATVEDKEDVLKCLIELKEVAEKAHKTEVEKLEVKQVEVQQKSEPKVEEVKEKKTRKRKEEVKEAYETNTEVIPPVITVANEDIPPVIETVEAEIVEDTKKSYEKYDRGIKEHTSFLAGHLTKAYGSTWKSKEGLQAFSQSLTGTDFRDKKSGELAPSFISKLEGFFGASNSVL